MGPCWSMGMFTLWQFDIAFENAHLYLIYLFKMVSFYSFLYVYQRVMWLMRLFTGPWFQMNHASFHSRRWSFPAIGFTTGCWPHSWNYWNFTAGTCLACRWITIYHISQHCLAHWSFKSPEMATLFTEYYWWILLQGGAPPSHNLVYNPH